MLDTRRLSSPLVAAGAVLLLAGCGWLGDDAPQPVREQDPATTAALRDQIMFDPDLAGQNRADSAVRVPSGDGSVPTVDSGTEAIGAARADALRLVGARAGCARRPNRARSRRLAGRGGADRCGPGDRR